MNFPGYRSLTLLVVASVKKLFSLFILKVNLTKIRMGMDTFIQRPPSEDEDEDKSNNLQDAGQDTTKRLFNGPFINDVTR